MNNEITIEKGIPIPSGQSRAFSDTLKKCSVGDSFIFHRATLANFHASAKQLGMKVVTRKQSDGGYRIWRSA